jgi:hypothetical protein
MQPPLGAVTIPIVDICMFANNSIRRCEINDFKLNNTYNKSLHEKDPEGCFNEPLFMGFVGVYKPDKKSSERNFSEQLTETTKQLLIQRLDHYMKQQVEDVDTDYYQVELQCSNVASLTNMCMDFIIKNNYNDTFITEYLIDKLKPETSQVDLLKNIINDIISMRYKKENYKSKYGDDIGSFDQRELDDVLKNIMDSRFSINGYKSYYNAGIAINKKAADPFEITDNVVETDSDCRVWLNKKITEFVKFCKINGYVPVGIIPWKMFKISMIPVAKDEKFLEPYIEKLETFADGIQNIKEKAKKMAISNKEQLIEFYTSELDCIYGFKRQYAKKQIQLSSSPPSKFDSETRDFFNNV